MMVSTSLWMTARQRASPPLICLCGPNACRRRAAEPWREMTEPLWLCLEYQSLSIPDWRQVLPTAPRLSMTTHRHSPWGDEKPEILGCSNSQFGSISADAGQCPSSNYLRLLGALANGVFGPSVVEVNLPFGDASSGGAGWFCA
jgi:hypothetical protein